jgi:YggT family protein
MNLARGFGYSVLQLVLSLLWAYTWVVIIRAVITWVNPDPYNPIVRILHQLTEPLLRPIRRLVPPHKLGGLDLSPLILILVIQLVRSTIVYAVFGTPVRLF